MKKKKQHPHHGHGHGYHNPPPPPDQFAVDALRLEAVTCCVGFDDMLDVTLGLNMAQLDTMIVITSHEDKATHKVINKHGARMVQTDLWKKNGRNFNKGAAINHAFSYFQYFGWRMHLDADIALPDNFRRVLFNRTHLERECIYGADRMDVIGLGTLNELRASPQHLYGSHVRIEAPVGHRFIDPLNGYVPIGFFQLWHASSHRQYPYSLGSAAHDDTLFSAQWKEQHRRHLPTVVCHHVLAAPSVQGENWDGKRKQPRLS
jgi:hypothetical protein